MRSVARSVPFRRVSPVADLRSLDGRPDPALVDVDALERLVTAPDEDAGWPTALGVERGVPTYSGDRLAAAWADPGDRAVVATELARCLRDGPGVLVVRGAVSDRSALEGLSAAFAEIVRREAAEHPAGDHFAAAGANTRIWNSLQKTALVDPTAWVRYHASPTLALIAEAWLGPRYRLTAQVNIVHPGGAAQHPHRDYHLGFLTDEEASRFPRHVHVLSRFLTLQGAIAHTDMSLESGPTRVLPGSQRFVDGYVAWRDPRVVQLFEHHAVQLPLAAGDAVFFDPALLHAAGANHTDRDRVAHLYQISSSFGVPMESIDLDLLATTVHPALVEALETGVLDPAGADRVCAAAADAYPFPTNLDTDPPLGEMAPASALDVLRRAVAERWPTGRLADELALRRRARRP